MHHRDDVTQNPHAIYRLRIYPRMRILTMIEHDVVSFRRLLQLEIGSQLFLAGFIMPLTAPNLRFDDILASVVDNQ